MGPPYTYWDRLHWDGFPEARDIQYRVVYDRKKGSHKNVQNATTISMRHVKLRKKGDNANTQDLHTTCHTKKGKKHCKKKRQKKRTHQKKLWYKKRHIEGAKNYIETHVTNSEEYDSQRKMHTLQRYCIS